MNSGESVEISKNFDKMNVDFGSGKPNEHFYQ